MDNMLNKKEFWLKKLSKPNEIIPHNKNFNQNVKLKLKQIPNTNFFNIDDSIVAFGIANKASVVYLKPNNIIHSVVEKGDPLKITEKGDWCHIYTQICNGWIKKENITFVSSLDKKTTKHYKKFTQKNFFDELFSRLGDPYGLAVPNKTDCASYISQCLAKFGFFLPKTAGLFSYVLNHKTLNEIIPGDIIHMKEHVMVYLGKHNNDMYVINNLHSYYYKNKLIEPMRVCVINMNQAYRKNGKSWTSSIISILSYE